MYGNSPYVSYNKGIEKYVLVYKSWGKGIAAATSTDLINWGNH